MQSKTKVAFVAVEEDDAGGVTITTIPASESSVANDTANTMFNMYLDLMKEVTGEEIEVRRTEGAS